MSQDATPPRYPFQVPRAWPVRASRREPRRDTGDVIEHATPREPQPGEIVVDDAEARWLATLPQKQRVTLLKKRRAKGAAREARKDLRNRIRKPARRRR